MGTSRVRVAYFKAKPLCKNGTVYISRFVWSRVVTAFSFRYVIILLQSHLGNEIAESVLSLFIFLLICLIVISEALMYLHA